MYLYLTKTGPAKQVEENPSTMDFMAVSQGLLKIFRFAEEFQELVFSSGKFHWIPVASAETLKTSDARLHV